MGISEVLDIITIIMISIVFVVQIIGHKKSNICEIKTLLKDTAKEQHDIVQEQIAKGATEQFERFGVIQKSVQDTMSANRDEVNQRMGEFWNQIISSNEQIGRTVTNALQQSREEQNKQLHTFGEQVDSRLVCIQNTNTESSEKIKSTLESKMKALQESNEKRLEQMQEVVDQKLQKTLDTRISQSFELVNKQLGSVDQGLGEVKALAADARSLKNVLTNVKERGTYGEIRLEKLLSDILAPNQYEMNVEIADRKRVEFAVKLPGNGDMPLLLPIDSKFPIEDYNRLLDAKDRQSANDARHSLVAKIRDFAKDIRDKYIVPPKTTDFALMFLPTEGLYAEVTQDAALFDELLNKYKITVVGPTTLSALLASLQIGFKTLAVEQRSQEVWDALRAVKAEFVKFENVIDKVQKQFQTADKTLTEIVGTRTRAINRALERLEE